METSALLDDSRERVLKVLDRELQMLLDNNKIVHEDEDLFKYQTSLYAAKKLIEQP